MRIEDILGIGGGCDFSSAALALFRRQAVRCAPYREYLSLIGVDPASVDAPERIPHLPIELFKTHEVYCGSQPPQITFTSSTTGGSVAARHMMERVEDYEKTFMSIFRSFYGDPRGVAIFALLPGYLERQGSSLVYMADRLIRESGCGGFFLNDYDRLLDEMERCRRPKILLGVSYALWDLAERYAPKLRDTVVMETGGMKGHREELPKEQFHKILQDAFGVGAIHSEYGMAELTSQAYSRGGNRFQAPPWMRVAVRDLNDPFDVRTSGAGGAINITDLANLSSCAFVQTADLGTVHADGTFSVTGRVDRSEVRGCNLLVQ